MKAIRFSQLLSIALTLFALSYAASLVINEDFNHHTRNYRYTIQKATNDFGPIRARTSGAIRGLDGNGVTWPHQTAIINKQIRTQYLKNSAGGHNGGFLFDKQFSDVTEATLEYKVKFDSGFVWAYGGKLPGLGGSALSGNGAIPSGCTKNRNNIDNGFSVRLMWRQSGAGKPVRLVAYTYFPDRDINKCGVEIEIMRGLEKNKWYTIKQYIKLNTPGSRNGILKMYVNGRLELERRNILYRKSGKSNVKINNLIFNTYRGGSASDSRWWSPTTDTAFFDDFKVWI